MTALKLQTEEYRISFGNTVDPNNGAFSFHNTGRSETRNGADETDTGTESLNYYKRDRETRRKERRRTKKKAKREMKDKEETPKMEGQTE